MGPSSYSNFASGDLEASRSSRHRVCTAKNGKRTSTPTSLVLDHLTARSDCQTVATYPKHCVTDHSKPCPRGDPRSYLRDLEP